MKIRRITRNKEDILLDILYTTLVIIAIIAALAGCTSQGPTPLDDPTQRAQIAAQQRCREGARDAFTKLVHDKATVEQAQHIVDKACIDIDAANRKAIIDTERTKAILDYLPSTTGE